MEQDPKDRKDPNEQGAKKNFTDPQENEKDGNVLGTAFDAIFGDSEGGSSLSEEEGKDPDKQGSIKE